MTEKKSLKSTLLGIGASGASLMGICCGSGACIAACGAACAAPAASILGISAAGFSTLITNLLPVLTAISGVTFTIAYYSLYRKRESDCCDTSSPTQTNRMRQKWVKPAFWIGVFLSIAFYTYAIVRNSGGPSMLQPTCETDSSCSSSPDSSSTQCQPSECTPQKPTE